MAKYNIIEVKKGDMRMSVANLGGTIMSLHAPDAKGKCADVVLGFDKAGDYLKTDANFGAIIGRVANRIAGASFTLEGKKYKLAANESNGNHLHGGVNRFNLLEWDMAECSGAGWKGIMLHRLSRDGEEGYPGNLDVTVFYKLTDDNSLVVEYNAFTDKPTLCNLTQHSYFNLSGGKSKDALEHEVLVNADFYTPVNKKFVPTGEISKVAGSAIDFRKAKTVREAIESGDPIIAAANGGVDHSYVLKNADGDLVYAASACDPISGRQLDVYTTEPAVHFYTANFLNGTKGKGGAVYNKYAGLCFETQHIPDSIHQPHFPSTVLYPEDTYSSVTVYSF